MHFTLWASARASTGAHCEINWQNFLAFVAEPADSTSRDTLEGWSPARFRDNRRGRAFVEAVSCLVLDDDGSGQSTDALATRWAHCAGVVHTSFSHTEAAPRHRIVLRLSRDVTGDEYDRLWPCIASGHGLDPAPKDPSRLWYAPARGPGGYAWAELTGAPLDVDVILATAAPPAPVPTHASASPAAVEAPPNARRAAMAAALRAAWPGKGHRHAAQLALAGALRSEGWAEAEAVDFLTEVAGDRAKRAATCRHTWGRPADAPMTGWTRLRGLVDPVVADAARTVLGASADFAARLETRLSAVTAPPAPADAPEADGLVTAAGISFRAGGWDEPLQPPRYVVEQLFVAGSVSLFVAHGNSLKSMSSLSIGIAVATGRPWLERFPVRQGRTVVLDFERGPYEARRRIKLLRADGVTDFWHSAQPNVRTDEPELWARLVEVCPQFLIVDSLAAGALGVEENDTKAALPLSLAQKFAAATGAAILFIHHARKGTGGDRRESVRGSTAIFAAVDAVYAFEPIDGTDAAKRMRVECVKMNLGKEPAPFAIELTDEKGLVWYDEPAAVEGRNAESSEDLQNAIRLQLAQGPVAGVRALALKLGRRSERIRVELGLMLEAQEIVHIDDTYRLDDEASRQDRVLRFVSSHGAEPSYNSISRLAKAAKVPSSTVERMMMDRVIIRAIGVDRGGWLQGNK